MLVLHSGKRLFYACALISVGAIIYHLRHVNTRQGHIRDLLMSLRGQLGVDAGKTLQSRGRYIVDTTGCHIPHMDPFDARFKDVVSKWRPELRIQCSAAPPLLTYIEDGVLYVNYTALQHDYGNQSLHHCEYRPISRPNANNSNSYSVDDIKATFINNILIDTNEIGISVICYNQLMEVFYQYFFPIVPRRAHLNAQFEEKYRMFRKQQPRVKETYNVILLGIDSLSRLNVARYMPRTKDFLLRTLKAIEMKGYHKVADNTCVNMTPFLSGKYLEELPWNENISPPFDDFDLIWKHFSANGYRTLYGEDWPDVGIFDYLKKGFYRPPTDYYLRPYSIAQQREYTHWSDNKLCAGNKLEYQWVIEWHGEFIKTFSSGPFFSFTFCSRVTHDDIEYAGAVEEMTLEFLQQIHKVGALNNTFLFLFSDHGIRYGKFRQTYAGRLEERLPSMFIVPPIGFRESYPELAKALSINAHRLSTPFDIHRTLLDISLFTGEVPPNTVSERSMSLFSEIPPERTCAHASILSHWCSCHERRATDPQAADVRKATQYVVDYINKILAKYHKLCATLQISNVHTAMKTVINDDVMTFERVDNDVINRTVYHGDRADDEVEYLIAFSCEPSGAYLEATVRLTPTLYGEHYYEVVGDISRINEYGNQSSCITNHSDQKYCFCL